MSAKDLNKIIFSIVTVFFIVAIFYYIAMHPVGGEKKLNLNIERVATEEGRRQGLSDRASICDECGMLFVFESSSYFPFWMKGMNFDIDIIFLDEHMRVVDIFANVRKESYKKTPPETFTNTSLAKYVLELNSGKSKQLGIRVGDKLSL
jgi:uncharacterized membrane protein (UPF0127 family)